MASTANAAPILPQDFPKLSPGTSLAGNLQGTFGVVIIAIIISAFLDGILTMQTFTYYGLFPEDPMFRKVLVALIYFLDTAQFVCITDFGWWYLVRNWGNVEALKIIRPTFGIFVIFGSLAVFIVQCLFLERIWSLGKKFRYYMIPISILISIEFSFAMLGASFGVTAKPFTDISTRGLDGAVVGIWLGTGVAADVGLAIVMLTAVLSYRLHVKRTGFRKTESLSTKLIVYSVNTCLLTSIVAFLNIVFYYHQNVTENVHLVFNMILCRIFSNSLLASYNRRASIWSEEAASNLNGIIIQTEQTTDAVGRAVYVPGQRSTMVRMDNESNMLDAEPKSSIAERNWDLEMYPVSNKTIDIVPDQL